MKVEEDVRPEASAVTRLTRQEAFNQVVRGLKSQGWQRATVGRGAGEVCRYRSGPLKCAIGHLIPDEAYDRNMEGKPPGYVLACAGVEVEGPYATHFLNLMQFTHDDSIGRLGLHKRFQELAERQELEFPADCLAPEVEVLQ